MEIFQFFGLKKAQKTQKLIFNFFLLCLFVVNEKPTPCLAKTDALQILDTSGVKGGLIVHVSCGDGKLTAALRANDSYLVHGLDTDARNVEKARKYIQSLDLYGKVSVNHWKGDSLPYIDNLVNLVVSENLGKVPMEEVMRVLCPNGVAYIKQDDTWDKTVKPRPKEIDDWTHYLYDSTNNAVAKDTVVAPPHHIQWVSGPEWARSHDHLASVSMVVSSGGRIFYIVDEGPIATVALPANWFLVARDAFNGVLLWKRPIGFWEGHLRGFRSGPAELARRLVAIGDRVYVTLGYGKPVTALDAATGKTVKTYTGTDGTLEIVYYNNVIFLVTGDTVSGQRVRTLENWLSYPQYITTGASKRLMAVKADTGDFLWKKSDADTSEVMPTTLTVSNGRVFFQNTSHVICMDAMSGSELWRAPRPISINRWTWSTPTLVIYNDVLISADRDASAKVSEEKQAEPGQVQWTVSSRGGEAPIGEMIAFSAKTGEKLWSCECRETYNAPVDVFVTGGLVWSGDLVQAKDRGITAARDVITGEVKMQRPPDQEFFTPGMGHHRCYRNKATSRYLLLGRAGVEFINLESGKAIANHWVRGACQYGILPCNGLLYAPPHSCACFIRAKLNSFNALAAGRKPKAAKHAGPRLERGPAYSTIENRKFKIENPQDWPTYRHDTARSGSTKSNVPATLKHYWQSELGGNLTSPVVADGKVFVASVDTHSIYALDEEDGKVLWSYTVGGRVDSPPTIYKGLVLFGSADGWVYCLGSSDGELVWRFRAAPEDIRIVSYGQLESVWPVHGNVLVQDDPSTGSRQVVLYFAAGRSSYLDGGIYIYRLDPITGKKLSETCINSRDPNTGEEPKGVIKGTDMPGALPDVLSSDGAFVYMRHMRFDKNGIEQEQSVPHLYSPAGFLDGSWWHRTYWIVGTKMNCGWGGWLTAGRQVPAGRLLVLDGSSVYGFGRLNQYDRHGSHVGLDNASLHWPLPSDNKPWPKTQYYLFACDKTPKVIPAFAGTSPAPAKAGAQKRRPGGGMTQIVCRWSESVPLWGRAMVLADKIIFLAGPRDVFADQSKRPSLLAPLHPQGQACPRESGDDSSDEGRRTKDEGILYAVSAEDGKKLAEYDIESLPVYDGLIAANGRLYFSTQDGRLICMAKK